MLEKQPAKRAQERKKEGKAPTTQAGEYVREEVRHAKEGKHSVGNPKQAIAIGLSKARREGVDLKPPAKGKGQPGYPQEGAAGLRARPIAPGRQEQKLRRQEHGIAVQGFTGHGATTTLHDAKATPARSP